MQAFIWWLGGTKLADSGDLILFFCGIGESSSGSSSTRAALTVSHVPTMNHILANSKGLPCQSAGALEKALQFLGKHCCRLNEYRLHANPATQQKADLTSTPSCLPFVVASSLR